MNEAEGIQRVEAHLKVLGYPVGSVHTEYRSRRGKRLDVVVLHEGRVVIVFEIKRLSLLPQDEKLLPFDATVRQAQFAALEVEAKFYVVTDGHEFLWFRTDSAGRPTKVPNPKTYADLTEQELVERKAVDQLAVAKRAIRMLYEQSREHRWPPDTLPLLLYAYLEKERGDKTFHDMLLRRSRDESPLPEAVQAAVSRQRTTDTHVYEKALAALSESGFSRLQPADALQVLDEVLVKEATWSGAFRLPRWTSDLIVQLADIQAGHQVLDLNCGIGNLPSAIRLAGNATPIRLTLAARHPTDALWTLVQQLTFTAEVPSIVIGDPLAADQASLSPNLRFDRILVAPPFGLTIRDPRLSEGRNSPLSSEEAYLQHALGALLPAGRVVAVVPNGALSNPARASFRDVLTRHGLKAVFDLGTFLPGSSAAASIVVLERSAQSSRELFFANAQNRLKLDRFSSRELPGFSDILDRFNSWMHPYPSGFEFYDQAGLTATATPEKGLLNAGPYLARQASLHVASFGHFPLEGIAEVARGSAIRRSKHSGDIAFIAPGAIRPLEINLDPLDRAEEGEVRQYPNAFAVAGDIVLNGLSTYIAAAALVEEGRYPINRHVFRIRVSQRHVLPEYLVIAINSRYVKEALLNAATGSVMKMLTLAQLKKVLVPIPPLHVQAEIIQRVGVAREQRDAALGNLRAKEAALDALVQDLSTGDVA